MSGGQGINLDQVPAQNIDAERATLGAMLLGEGGKQAISDVIEALGDNGAEHFYREAHQKIYRAIMSLFESGKPSDLLTVTKVLDETGDIESVGGVPYVDEMIDSVPVAANAAYYAKMVLEESLRRKTSRVSARMYQDARDGTIEIEDTIANAEAGILSLNTSESDESPLMFDAVTKTMAHLKRVHDNQGELLGLPTGFKKLDALTLGLIDSDYIILAGRPSMGKSALLGNIIRNVSVNAARPVGSLVFNLETAQVPFVTRMLSDLSGLGFKDLREGFISDDQWEVVIMESGRLAQSPIYVVSRLRENLSPRLMRSMIRRLKMKHEIGLIAVDHVQLMVGDRHTENRQQEMSSVSRELKRMGVEFNVPMVVLSQLSRKNEGRPNPRPILSDLRETGSFEQDADLVLFLHWPGKYIEGSDDETRVVIIGKQRNGPLDDIKMGFDGGHMRFSEL